MQILNKTTEKVVTVTYEITTDYHGDVIYIDYYDKDGYVIDSILRDSDGNDLSFMDDAAELLDQIQDFIGEHGHDEVDMSSR